jgi:uncharacterized membrane protein
MSEANSIKIARLEVQMSTNTTQLGRVESKVDTLINKIDNMTLVQTQVTAIREELNALKKHNFRVGWVYPSVSAVVSLVFGYLVLYALKVIK